MQLIGNLISLRTTSLMNFHLHILAFQLTWKLFLGKALLESDNSFHNALVRQAFQYYEEYNAYFSITLPMYQLYIFILYFIHYVHIYPVLSQNIQCFYFIFIDSLSNHYTIINQKLKYRSPLFHIEPEIYKIHF